MHCIKATFKQEFRQKSLFVFFSIMTRQQQFMYSEVTLSYWKPYDRCARVM